MIEQCILDQIQPVVLVGGQSKRFGRDKLIEPINGTPMAAIPINTLRQVFGPRVAIVGQCDQQVTSLADRVIHDPYPGLGPVGGLCAALEYSKSDVFVCAGDLVAIDEQTIRTIIAASFETPDALAYLAMSDRLQPTIGLYRADCVSHFKNAVETRKLKLGMVLSQESVFRVPVDSGTIVNINRPDDL